MKLQKRKFDVGAFMQRLGINRRILAELAKVSTTSIFQWKKAGRVSVKHIAVLRTITKGEAKKKQKWVAYDLSALREELSITRGELAEALQVCHINTQYWERNGKIPKNKLPLVKKLERER